MKMPLGMEVDLAPGHNVLDGDPALPFPRNGTQPPIFFPCLLWPNGWMDQDATWNRGRPRPMPHCARWGPSSPPFPQRGGGRGTPPQFSAHIGGQTAGWITMPLGTKVGLGPRNIVFDADPALPSPPLRGGASPCLLWPNGCMDQDAT